MLATIDKGHAEKVPESEVETDIRVCCIPHHGVVNDENLINCMLYLIVQRNRGERL